MALRRRPKVPPPPLLCRWDLDKTYLRSEFETLRQLWRTARERGEDKVAVPGVPVLMKAMRAAADASGRDLRVWFVSASPPQIGQAIRDKLALDGVPYDGIVFKDQLEHIRRGRFRNLREQVGYKLGELLRGRFEAPRGAAELLFGDDWESDPLIYSLYAEVLAGRLRGPRLAGLLSRLGVDPEMAPALLAQAEPVRGLGTVDRIFINLARPTPPAGFRPFGLRLVPAFNYFQTALVLAADGVIDPAGLARVGTALIADAGYTVRRLQNSLEDLVRREVLPAVAVEPFVDPLRAAGLLPGLDGRPQGWLRRTVGRLRSTRPVMAPAPAAGAPLDWDAILDARTGRGRAMSGAVPS